MDTQETVVSDNRILEQSSATCSSSTLSTDEFQRIQEQLLDLRSQNYTLVDENEKLKSEHNSLREKLKSQEEELQKAHKMSNIFRRRGTKDFDFIEDEMNSLRRKLATQEEEFRLQQSTLMEELNKVIKHSDDMEVELARLKDGKVAESDSVTAVDFSNLRLENEELRSELAEMKQQHDCKLAEFAEQLLLAEKSAAEISAGGIEELAQAEAKISSLESRVEESKDISEKNSMLVKEISALKGSLKAESDEKQRLVAELKQEIANCNEKFRKKQESYVQLNEEKERQYQEFKKSLDGVVQKKDTEIGNLILEIQQLKNQLKSVEEHREKERLWVEAKKSHEQEIISLKADHSDLREQNEGFQIQLQETHSANDCLSAQLQEARNDVLQMQKEVAAANESANRRKELLDEMASHVEELKDEQRDKMHELEREYSQECERLKTQLEDARNSAAKSAILEKKINELEADIARITSLNELLQADIKEKETMIVAIHAESEKRLKEIVQQSEEKLVEVTNSLKADKSAVSAELEKANNDREICIESMIRLKQEVKDKEEQLKVVEKKHSAVMKDTKRQAATEKKRADRLQEKLQEVLNEINNRARSPGFEEIRAADVLEGKRNHTDSGSISSWSMLSGNNHKIESDQQSTHTADNESSSSVTMLESENQDLVSRIGALQKVKFELEERVQMLEESNSAMAEDLVKKSAIIEQFVKEKPMNLIPGSPTSDKLSGSLKKVMDFVKLDQSAGDIKEMNRRLQLMLEETLTKNMHLTKDLEIMSQEVSRLSELHPQEKIRKL